MWKIMLCKTHENITLRTKKRRLEQKNADIIITHYLFIQKSMFFYFNSLEFFALLDIFKNVHFSFSQD